MKQYFEEEMKQSIWRSFIGIFLVVIGVVLLLQFSGIYPGIVTSSGYIFAALFAAGGIAFFFVLIEDKSRWWAVIPGMILLGLSGLIVLSIWMPHLSQMAAAIFLGSIGLSFMLVYWLKREFWWALIPAMIMIGLAVMLALMNLALFSGGIISERIPVSIFLGFIGLGFAAVYIVRRESWWPIIPAGVMISVGAMIATGSVGVLFLGMGLTFGLLSVLPVSSQPLTWALIPAACLFLLGLMFPMREFGWAGNIFPVMLILTGCYLVIRAVINKRSMAGQKDE